MSDGVVCIVQARMGSSRLPGKVLMGLAGRPMLRFMLDRLAPLTTLGIDRIVVATSTDPRDDPVEATARGADVAVVRGSERDVLSRYVEALDAFPATTVVRLTADCPLADPQLVAGVIDRHREAQADFTCNVLPRTFPKGLDVEVVAAAALRAAHAEAADPVEREHVTPFFYRHPERFRLANLLAPAGFNLGRERWTVDMATDLEFLRAAVAAVGNPLASWRTILDAVGPQLRPPVGQLVVRPARPYDAARLLAWRNDPTTVQLSRTGRPVEPHEHDRWFAERLDDPGTRIWIGEVDGEPVGEVRVDVRDGVGEVDVAVAPEHRGRGHARALLAEMEEEVLGDYQVRELVARVHPVNEPSERAFRAVGFVEAGDPDADGFRSLRWARGVPIEKA